MTNEEILKLSLKKAESKGFTSSKELFDNVFIYQPQIYKKSVRGKMNNLNDYSKFISWFDEIMTPKFAKAFWKDLPQICYYCGGKCNDQGFCIDRNAESCYDVDEHAGMYAWQYHLQQMVLQNEPLKYLEKFL